MRCRFSMLTVYWSDQLNNSLQRGRCGVHVVSREKDSGNRGCWTSETACLWVKSFFRRKYLRQLRNDGELMAHPRTTDFRQFLRSVLHSLLTVFAYYTLLSLEFPNPLASKLFYRQSLLLITSRCISNLHGAKFVETNEEIPVSRCIRSLPVRHVNEGEPQLTRQPVNLVARSVASTLTGFL